MAENPAGAADAAQKLAEESAAVAGMVVLQDEIRTGTADVTDEALKKRYNDLSAKIDANLKAMPTEKDPGKRKTLVDVAAFQGEKAAIDKTTAGAAPPPDQEQKPEEPAEPDMTKDPGGWLKYQFANFKKYLDEIIGFITGIAGFFGVKTVLDKSAKKAAGTPGTPEKTDPARLEKATRFLKDKFNITDDEFKKFAGLKLGDFLKPETKPDGIDPKRLEALKSALTANKNSSDNDETLIADFVLAKKDNWKEPAPAVAKASSAAPKVAPSSTKGAPPPAPTAAQSPSNNTPKE